MNDETKLNEETKNCDCKHPHPHHDHHDHHGPHGHHGPHDLKHADPNTLYGLMRLCGHALRFSPDQEAAFNGLSADEQAQLKTLLTKLLASLKPAEEEAKEEKAEAKDDNTNTEAAK